MGVADNGYKTEHYDEARGVMTVDATPEEKNAFETEHNGYGWMLFYKALRPDLVLPYMRWDGQIIDIVEHHQDGGPGSGNHHHAGVEGQLGGSAPNGIHSVDDKYFPDKDSWRRDPAQGWNKERKVYLAEMGHSVEQVEKLDSLITEHVRGNNVDADLADFVKENPNLIKDVASFERKAAQLRRQDDIQAADKDIKDSQNYIDEINNGEYDYLGDREYVLEAAQSQLEMSEFRRKELDEPLTMYRKGDYSDSTLSFTTDRNGVTLNKGTDNESQLYPDHQNTLSELEKQGIVPIGGFGAKYNFYAGESSEVTFVKLPGAESNADGGPRSDGELIDIGAYRSDKTDWITVNGTHVMLNEEGVAQGGGKLKGQTFSNAKSVKKESGSKGSGSFKSRQTAFTPKRDDYVFEVTDDYGTIKLSDFEPYEQHEMWKEMNRDKLKELYQQERQQAKAEGRKSSASDVVNREWYGAKTELVTDDTPTYMDDMKADEVLAEALPNNVFLGWFRDADSTYKPRVIDSIISSSDTRNAALSIMYDNYRHESDSANQGLSFEEFLTTPVKMYRGGHGQQHTSDDIFSAYSFSRTTAEKFAGSNGRVYEAEIRPIDTWGSITTNKESEIMVPSWIAPNGNADEADDTVDHLDGGIGSGFFKHHGIIGQQGGSVKKYTVDDIKVQKRPGHGVQACMDLNEAASYMQNKYGIKVADEVKVLDPDVCIGILAGAEAVFESFPEAAKRLNTIVVGTGNFLAQTNSEKLMLNAELCGDIEKAVGFFNKNASRMHRNMTLESIGVHEMGHAVIDAILMKKKNLLSAVLDHNRQAMAHDIMVQCTKRFLGKEDAPYSEILDTIKKEISIYSFRKNLGEGIAESFADVYANDDCSELSDMVVSEVEKRYANAF